MKSLSAVLGKHADLVLVLLTIGILVVLLAPIPARALDFLLLLNFSFALLILLLTLYTEKPVQFSTFPAILLLATLFRLALNIAATRLILTDANAGQVINAVGSVVVGGNYVIGLIVFFILVVIQYVVVTSGAQRVAEVAARFTLDSMPGQQMSIDADLNMGFIDQEEAQKRRKNIEKEANFYGAMDGASKFVKGDAIAGIIILLINILGGWAIGVAQMGMKWDEALRTYTLLTIGDGIVTQVPALVIALGTGIIVTRSGADTRLSSEILSQLTAYPKTWFLVMFALLVLLAMPGIPAGPVLVLLVMVGAVAWYAHTRQKAKLLANLDDESANTDANHDASETQGDLYAQLAAEPIEVHVGVGLSQTLLKDQTQLKERIEQFRKQYAMDSGFVLPKVRVREDKRLEPMQYALQAQGLDVGQGELRPQRVLAIHVDGDIAKLTGEPAKDPTFGLPAVWIEESQKPAARRAGYTLVDPLTVLMTHLSEVTRQQAARLLTRRETERMLEATKKSNPGLVDELIPTILTLGDVQKVLQNLLAERVSIRQLETILEVLLDKGRTLKDPDVLSEHVRMRLGALILQPIKKRQTEVMAITLDAVIEKTLTTPNAPLDPRFAEQLLGRLGQILERMASQQYEPVVLCSPEVRRVFKRLTERLFPQLTVLSMAEIPNNIPLKSFAVLSVSAGGAA